MILPSKPFTQEEKEKIITIFDAKFSINAIARYFEVSPMKIHAVLGSRPKPPKDPIVGRPPPISHSIEQIKQFLGE